MIICYKGYTKKKYIFFVWTILLGHTVVSMNYVSAYGCVEGVLFYGSLVGIKRYLPGQAAKIDRYSFKAEHTLSPSKLRAFYFHKLIAWNLLMLLSQVQLSDNINIHIFSMNTKKNRKICYLESIFYVNNDDLKTYVVNQGGATDFFLYIYSQRISNFSS